ncbi:MAG TPA: alpha/beta fold hydrolase, partial [Thermoleophilaceae bacterium]|nr:alpha/beta fold hydrolase [Thermoleophilaceae bacterium]
LDLAPAHVVGASLGGMVAQTMAARSPASVRTLTSIMSTTGHRLKGQPHPGRYRYLLRPAPRERAAYLEHSVELWRAIGSPGFPADEDAVRERAGIAFDRARNPAGTGRQMAAVLKSGNRTGELDRITAPTLVIHGDQDTLVRPSGGKATADAIPGAELMMIEGMGHDMPPQIWPRVVDAVAERARRFDGT